MLLSVLNLPFHPTVLVSMELCDSNLYRIWPRYILPAVLGWAGKNPDPLAMLWVSGPIWLPAVSGGCRDSPVSGMRLLWCCQALSRVVTEVKEPPPVRCVLSTAKFTKVPHNPWDVWTPKDTGLFLSWRVEKA